MGNGIFFGTLLFFFCACSFTPPIPSPNEEPAGIAGSVLDRNGTPAAGAYVYAYRSARGGLRGPADFAAETDANGLYFLDLVPGKYYLVARSRRQAEAGPPRPGDAWALYPRNPVTVLAERSSRADFRLQTLTQPMVMRDGTLGTGDTGFTGRLLDASGAGVPGAFVLAYRDDDLRRMPDATSPAVGEDGVFTLYLPAPGRWCLAARTRTRGQPSPGELYGILTEGKEGCRNVEAGEMQPVGTILLRPHP